MTTNKPRKLVAIVCMLLMLAPAASAQVASITPGTITVLGEGSASIQADEATVVITIGSDYDASFEDPLTMQHDSSEVAPVSSVNADNVIDAIIAFGIPVNDVTPVETAFMGEWGSEMGAQPATILVTITQPTVEGLSDLLEVVRTAAHTDGLFVNQFGVIYSVEDCRALRQEARANAFNNARAEAEDQAAAMNTTLGAVVASKDTVPLNAAGYYQTNSCNTSVNAVPYTMVYMASQFDPGLPAEVTVFVATEVSFEIP